MTRPNPNIIGHMDCPFCGEKDCPCCENKRERLYYRCPNCWTVQPPGPGFNAYIVAHMRPLADDEEPAGQVDNPPPVESADRERNWLDEL